MTISVAIHGKNNAEFKARGYATTTTYNNLYPVVLIETKDVVGAGWDSVALFLSPEQLAEVRKSITAALRDYNKQKLELNKVLNR